MQEIEIGLRQRIEEIRKAVENEMYASALSLSLVIPDICSKIEYDSNGKDGYIKWFDEHITNQYIPQHYIDENDEIQFSSKRILTGERCYGLRCSFLHSGNNDVNKCHYDEVSEISNNKEQKYRIILAKKPIVDGISLDIKYNSNEAEYEIRINVDDFCERICQAAEETLKNYPEDKQEKYKVFIQKYEILKDEDNLFE